MQKLTLSFISLAILNSYAQAENIPSTTILEEVVVSASKSAFSLQKTPAAINKVTYQTLQQKRPQFIGEVLNQTAGVQMTNLGNEQHNMSIRQPLSYNAVYLYMEDGVPIRPVGLFNHNALYEINLMGSNDVEVLKGPASALYGSNAVGGAVNFNSQAPSPVLEGLIGVQSADAGHLRRVDYAVSDSNKEGTIGARLSGYSSRRTGGWQDYNDAEKDSLTLRQDWQISEALRLKNLVTYNRLYTDMPGSLNPDDFQNRQGFSYNTFTWRRVEALRLSSNLHILGDNGSAIDATLYMRHNRTDQLPSYLIFATGAGSASGRITKQSFTSYGLDLHHRQNFSDARFSLTTGITLERTPMEAQDTNLSIVRDPTSLIYTSYTPTTIRRDYSVMVDNKALYGQLEYRPSDAWQIVLGGRYDHIRYGFENNLTPSAVTGALSQSQSYHHFSPKIGANFSITPNWSVYSNLSQGFTPPEVSAQFGASQVAPVLRESTFNNMDIGTRWRSADKRFYLDVGVYRLTGKDEIVSYSSAPGSSVAMNSGKTRHQGVEFAAGYQAKDQFWYGKISGSVAKHTYVDYATSPTQNFNGKNIPAAPKFLANLELGLQPIQDLRLSFETQYMHQYWMDDANTVAYAGHTLFHFRAAYRVSNWEMWMALQNIGNKKYAEIAASSYKGTGSYLPNSQDTYSPGAPRNLVLGLRYHFGAAE